ncbi:MAG TPA: hypothetical protein VF857_10910, partial [Spirochaetota bacterium]
MNVKTKIGLGIGFIFLQLFIISSFSVYHAFKVARIEKSLFIENIRSIQYSENMLTSIEKLDLSLSKAPIKKSDTINNLTVVDEIGKNLSG